MAKAKFEVIIGDIDEDQLGSLLGKMSDNMTVGIKLTSRGTTAPMSKSASQDAIKSAPAEQKLPPRQSTVADMVRMMPSQFTAKDFIPAIEACGFNGNSITHFLREAIKHKLIERVPGLLGNKSAYRKK